MYRSFLHSVQTGSGVHPLSYPMDTRGSFSGDKGQEGEADHVSSSSNKVKNVWSYTSIPHVFTVRCLIKHMDNFPFVF
jgi:hypothetical protein